MKICLIAMSGVRVIDPDLIAVGLTLPGFVERSEVIASLPSLALLTLAALTPDGVDVEYHEVADLGKEFTLPPDCDLAAISTYTAQAGEAYTLADRLRAQGVPVVLGGLHVSACPEEALEHADAIIVGEGERLWPQLVADFRAGHMQREYRQRSGDWFDLADAPLPRFSLLDIARYNRLTVQTSRGCPHRCDFCAASPALVPRWQAKPAERVMAEVAAIKSLWRSPFIEFADDNSFPDPAAARPLIMALREAGVRWFTETDIAVAEDPTLLDAMRESGCRQILIGLESPTEPGLDGLELRRNWKLRRLPNYLDAVRAIQDRGITVNGCFILGLDGDTPEVFDRIHQFVEASGLFEVQVTVLTPFPGTPLYARLEREGRLLAPRAWERCTLFDVNHVPRQMTPAQLHEGLLGLMKRLYAPGAVRSRREEFFHNLRRRRVPGAERQQEEWAT